MCHVYRLSSIIYNTGKNHATGVSRGALLQPSLQFSAKVAAHFQKTEEKIISSGVEHAPMHQVLRGWRQLEHTGPTHARLLRPDHRYTSAPQHTNRSVPSSLVQLVQLLRDAHRWAKLDDSPRPETVTSEVIQPDWHHRDVHPVLVQRAEGDHGHPRLPIADTNNVRSDASFVQASNKRSSQARVEYA